MCQSLTDDHLWAHPPSSLPQDGSLRLVFGNQAERKMLDARQDFEDVSKLTKAEMARFDKEKVEDFKKAVADYADALVLRQREVRLSLRLEPHPNLTQCFERR